MKQIIIAALLMLGMCQAIAQNIKRPESYNYQRGREAMQEQKYDEAIEFFNKDIQENPKNGYHMLLICYLDLFHIYKK